MSGVIETYRDQWPGPGRTRNGGAGATAASTVGIFPNHISFFHRSR